VHAKRSEGGTAPERIAEQLQAARAAVARTLSWLAALPAVPAERETASPGGEGRTAAARRPSEGDRPHGGRPA